MQLSMDVSHFHVGEEHVLTSKVSGDLVQPSIIMVEALNTAKE